MEFRRQAYAVAIRQMRKAWNFIAFGIFFYLARKHSGAYAHRLSKLNTVLFDDLGFKIEAFARPTTGQQSAIICDMRHDFYLAAEELRRRHSNASNRRGNARKCACTYQRKYCRYLRRFQAPGHHSDNSAKSQGYRCPSPEHWRALQMSGKPDAAGKSYSSQGKRGSGLGFRGQAILSPRKE